MRRYIFAVFALCLTFVLATPAAAQPGRGRDHDRDRDRGPQETETVERTLALPAGGTVRLKTFSGRVEITGAAGNQVVVKAVRRASRERLDDVKLEITQSGNVIEIDANHRTVERRNDNVVETDFAIQVPSQATLDLRTFSAPITVDNVSGEITVDGFSSDIRLMNVAGPLQVKTFSGNITLRLPDSARGNLSFDSFSGHFTSDLPVTLSSSSRRNFRGALNGGGDTELRLKTFSGDVSIRR